MRACWIALFVLTGCETPGAKTTCPTDVPLTDDDIPCDCSGGTVEALTCGDLICRDEGVELSDSGACGSTTTEE